MSCTTLLSADKESALTRAKTRVPRNQSRTATRRARASQVLCLDSPMRTLNLRRSFFVSGVAYQVVCNFQTARRQNSTLVRVSK